VTDDNVIPVTAEETARLLELGDAVRESLHVCPIRDCDGHDGPHEPMGEYTPHPETWTT
jgi:hypothetical protein